MKTLFLLVLALGIASQADAEGFRYFLADTRVFGSCQVSTFTDKKGREAPSASMSCGDLRSGDIMLGLEWYTPQGRAYARGAGFLVHKRVPEISECSEHTGDWCVVPVRFSHWSMARNWISSDQRTLSDRLRVYLLSDDVGLLIEHARKARSLDGAFGERMLRIPLDGFAAAYADFTARRKEEE